MSQQNKAIISEEDLNEVSMAIEEEAKDNPNIISMRDIENGNHQEPEEEITEGIAGEGDLILPEDNSKGVDLFECVKTDLDNGDEYMIKASQEIADGFGLPMSDIRTLFTIANRYKAKEKFSIYNAMPETVKKIINGQIAEAGAPLDSHSKSLYCELFMEEFISNFVDKYLDKEIIDFNKSVKETIGSITNLTDMYTGHIRYMMEVSLKEKAKKAATPEAKAIYLGCSKAFTDSYTYTKMINVIHTKSKVRRKLYKNNFQFNSICRDFNYLNKDTKFSIRNVEQLYTGLKSNLGEELGLTDDDCKCFTILFIRSAENLDMSKVFDAMYVYYTIFNILNLSFDTNKSKFYYTVVNNVKKVFNAIWEATGNDLRFDIGDEVDWTEDAPSEEDLKAFDESLSHLDNDSKEGE